MAAKLPVRNCVVCGLEDKDPRHEVILPDMSTAYHHMDCGSRLNPPCESCTEIMKDSDNAHGSDLRKHLTKDF